MGLMKSKKKMSMGGEADHEKEEDLVKQVMKQRMAKGGEVESLADFSPNEFDELELNPAPKDDSGPGNEHGDSTLLEDAVSKVMLSRKKQSNPRPA